MNKKITLLFITPFIYSLSFSQINFGFKAGVAESFIQTKFRNEADNYDLKLGYQVGAFAEIPLSKRISFQPSLLLTQKGFRKIEGSRGTNFYWNRNFSKTYLELPIEFVLNFPLNKKHSIQIGSGPVFGIGLFGKNKTIITFIDSMPPAHTEYWESTDSFEKRFDFGLDFLIGFKCDRISINANYNHGLLDISNSGDNSSTKNRSFALTLGYLLKKK